MSQFPLMAVHLAAIWSDLGSGECLSSHSWLSTTRRSHQVWGVVNVSVPTHGCPPRGDLIRSREWWMSQFPLMAVDDAAIWSGLGSGECLSSHSWLSTSRRSDQVWGVVNVSVPTHGCRRRGYLIRSGEWWMSQFPPWLSTSRRSDQVWGVVNVSVPTHGCPPHGDLIRSGGGGVVDVSVPTHGCRRRGDLIRSGEWWMSQFPLMAVDDAAIWSGLGGGGCLSSHSWLSTSWRSDQVWGGGEWWMSQFPLMAVDDAAIWSGLGSGGCLSSHSWLSTSWRSDQVWGVVDVSVPLMAVHDAAIWSGLGSGGCLSSHSWLSTTRRSDQVWGVVDVSVPTHGCPPHGDLIRSGGGEWWMSQFPLMAVDDAAIWSGLGSGGCLSSHSWLSTSWRSDQVWGVVDVSVPLMAVDDAAIWSGLGSGGCLSSHSCCRRRGDLIRSGEWWMSQFPLMAVHLMAIWLGLGSGECLSSHSWLSTTRRSDQVWSVVDVSVPTHGCPPHGDLIRSGEWWMSQFPLMAVDDAAIWSGLGGGGCLSSHSWLSMTRRSDQVWGVVDVSVPTHGCPRRGDLIRSREWWMSQFPLMAVHDAAIWSGLGSGECLSSHSWLSTSRRSDQI